MLAKRAAASEQARKMTLTAVRHFDPSITDALLEGIDAELAALPSKP
jgi:hypothetical protein